MSFSYEQLQSHFPGYLSDSAKRKLAHDLAQFSNRENPKKFYTSLKSPNEIRQGDVFHNIESLIYPQKKFKNISAVLLTNTCGASIENKRALQPYLTFAPLVDFLKLEAILKNNRQEEKIKLFSQSHQINVIYFPPTQTYSKGTVALLDRVFSIPLTDVLNNALLANRESSLSTLGWYFFLFNLSYFYCRMGEKIERN